ncbi:uncharacterized protein LOC111334923 [Stylophora pistillata]|uniref:uncharacterized protein LOC111334923 n=1 Tax=Stylophora pistillata TaxID=50429 RepID=UPI000C0572FB|nr:uncharacterized protein LOC111334923 [Stylophora pistillata]
MQQIEEETIDQFVCRLRQKAISCEFPSMDEAICDQIIEKCRDPKLHQKFLEKSSEATLTVLRETARVYEAVNTQMQSIERPEQLNVLRVGPLNSPQARSITSEGTSVDIMLRTLYADVFSGVGKLKNFQLNLHVNKDVKPVAQPVRRLPFGLRDKVDKKLDELLKEDIIEEVPSGPTERVSPLVVVPKPDGDIRVCVYMRRANEAIERERHPIPTIEEVGST